MPWIAKTVEMVGGIPGLPSENFYYCVNTFSPEMVAIKIHTRNEILIKSKIWCLAHFHSPKWISESDLKKIQNKVIKSMKSYKVSEMDSELVNKLINDKLIERFG